MIALDLLRKPRNEKYYPKGVLVRPKIKKSPAKQTRVALRLFVLFISPLDDSPFLGLPASRRKGSHRFVDRILRCAIRSSMSCGGSVRAK